MAVLLVAFALVLRFTYLFGLSNSSGSKGSPILPMSRDADPSLLARADFDRTPLRIASDTDVGPGAVEALVADADGVWLAIAGGQPLGLGSRIVRVDRAGRLAVTATLNGFVSRLVSTRETLWAFGFSPLSSRGRAWRIDGRSGRDVATVDLPGFDGYLTNIAASDDALWVGRLAGRPIVEQIDARSGRAVATIDVGVNLFDAAATEGALWYRREIDTLGRIDAKTHAVTRQKLLPGGVFNLAPGDGVLWVLGFDGSLLDVDLASRIVGRRSPAVVEGKASGRFLAAEGALWLFDRDALVSRIDPETREVRTVDLTHFGPDQRFFAVGFDSIWIVHQQRDGHARLRRLQPTGRT
jgi:hypothetical protein